MPNYVLTTPVITNGSFTVTRNDNGTIVTRGSSANEYNITKPIGTPDVNVTCTPNSGYAIVAWPVTGFTAPGAVLSADPSGTAASFDLTLSSNETVATPTIEQYHAVTVNAVGNGTVSVGLSDGSAAASGSSVTVYVKHGASVMLTHAAASGHQHASTTGATTITAAGTITVTFEPIPVTATAFGVADDDDDFVSKQDSASRKHLLLKVPDYELAPDTVYLSSKNTLLQIGDGTDVTATGEDGHDLLELAVDQPARATASTATPITFLDDVRNRGTSSDAGGTFSGALATPPSESTARAGGRVQRDRCRLDDDGLRRLQRQGQRSDPLLRGMA